MIFKKTLVLFIIIFYFGFINGEEVKKERDPFFKEVTPEEIEKRKEKEEKIRNLKEFLSPKVNKVIGNLNLNHSKIFSFDKKIISEISFLRLQGKDTKSLEILYKKLKEKEKESRVMIEKVKNNFYELFSRENINPEVALGAVVENKEIVQKINVIMKEIYLELKRFNF